MFLIKQCSAAIAVLLISSSLLFVSTHNINGPFEEIFRWKQIEYDIIGNSTDNISFLEENSYENLKQSQSNIPFIAYNNVPMGVTHYKGKLFITMPRRRLGIPSTLNYIYTNSALKSSPQLRAFPNYQTNELHPHQHPDSNRIVSVYRTRLDVCGRLWFIDTGLLEYPNNNIQIQKPSIWAINLKTHERVVYAEIPETIVARGNGLASITIDVDEHDCNNAFGYIPDLATYHLYVYSLNQNKLWSISHNYFSFDPLHGDFDISSLKFQWNDGIFSITLGNINPDGYRHAYFHAMASVSEFVVSTKILRNETLSTRSYHAKDFMYLGSRGEVSQSAMHDYDSKSRIIFYTQVGINGISCWNTNKPFSTNNYILLQSDDTRMIYPSDLTIDQDGVVWIMTNSMPLFIYSHLNTNIFNFRIWRQSAQEAVKNTVCDDRPVSYHRYKNMN